MNILRREDSFDSDYESHPLLSSDASRSSVGGGLMWPCSETSEFEQSDSRSSFALHRNPNTLPSGLLLHTFRNNSRNPPYIMPSANTYGSVTEKAKITNSSYNISCSSFGMNSSKNNDNTQNSIVTIFSIWNTVMGSSLVAMAWGMQKSGILAGFFLTILMGGLCLYTCYIILQTSRDHGLAEEVPALCHQLLGPFFERVAQVFSIIVLLGACIVYWVLMSNFLYQLINFVYDESTMRNQSNSSGFTSATVICPSMVISNLTGAPIDYVEIEQLARPKIYGQVWNLRNTVPIFVSLLMFPVMNSKNTTFFTKFNCLGTMSVFYLFFFVIFKSAIWGINFHAPTEALWKPTFTTLTGMLSLSYFVHNIIITIMKRNRDQNRNGRDLSIAYILVIFTYAFIGGLYYLSFPMVKTCIEDNIFNNFETSDILTVIARFLFLFQIVTTYPLVAFMLRKNVLGLFVENERQSITPTDPNHEQAFPLRWTIGFNIIIIIICILVACLYPKVGVLVRFTGAISGFIYIFTIPCLLKYVSLKKQGELQNWHVVLFITIALIGACNLMAQFVLY